MSGQNFSTNNPFANNDENAERSSNVTQPAQSSWNPFASPPVDSNKQKETQNYDASFDPFEESKKGAKQSEWINFSPDGKVDDSFNPFQEIDKANRPQDNNPYKEKNKQVMEEFVNKVSTKK